MNGYIYCPYDRVSIKANEVYSIEVRSAEAMDDFSLDEDELEKEFVIIILEHPASDSDVSYIYNSFDTEDDAIKLCKELSEKLFGEQIL